MKMEKIVVVDDNQNDVQLMKRVLERAGYDVLTATNGEKGLEVIAQSLPQCIMVDFRMPGMDGYEVCRRVKSDPALQTIPVLMLTGADQSINVIEGLDAGADDFVTKSSEIEVILARVRALLRVKAYQDRIVEQAEQLRNLYEEVTHKSDRIMALNQRLNNDLQVARRVQEALLPEREYRGGAMEIRSSYIPSETLSGDFYDYFVQGGKLYLFVADVSGHGLAASILVSLLKSYLHSETQEEIALSEFMDRLNNFLFSASLPSQYATGVLGRYDRTASTFVVANAAHPPFLHFRKKTHEVITFEQPGHLLGAMIDMKFEEQRIDVESGDLLFIYTDGLTDRKAVSGEFYPLERIAAILQESNGEDLAKVHEKIFEDVSRFGTTEDFKDDIAFVLARID